MVSKKAPNSPQIRQVRRDSGNQRRKGETFWTHSLLSNIKQLDPLKTLGDTEVGNPKLKACKLGLKKGDPINATNQSRADKNGRPAFFYVTSSWRANVRWRCLGTLFFQKRVSQTQKGERK
jgi:hypothetical protein